MTKSLRKEILRKFFHLLEIPVVLAYTVLKYFWGDKTAILVLTGAFLMLLEAEHYRLEVHPKIPKEFNILRPRERDNVTGSIYFITSTIICFAVFDYQIALLALLLTVFGDLASALVGIRYGKTKIFRNKTLQGFLAGLAVKLLVGSLVLPNYPLIAVLMAAVASVVELFTSKLDDNLTVPLFAGFTGHILGYLMHANLSVFPGPIDWLFHLF